MNKLVLIGNGFDLAHGLKSKYSDFLLWYLKEFFSHVSFPNKHEDELMRVILRRPAASVSFNSFKEYNEALTNNDITPNYKNTFLKKIITENYINNWVDIESLYFSILKSFCRRLEKHDIDKSASIDSELRALNKCFDLLKEKLIAYLLTIENSEKKENEDIHSHINKILIDNKSSNILFLNFNYTTTLDMYIDTNKYTLAKIINIHGKLVDDKNPIIFGYGDELDPFYEKIERLNDNEFLRNIKSFDYFKAKNYHQLLRFLDDKSHSFEVHIMGHSCGVSDRLLLSNIFEHEKCASIKIYYYQKNYKEDDFIEKTQEISRHFSANYKSKMRRIINPYSECLPLTKYNS